MVPLRKFLRWTAGTFVLKVLVGTFPSEAKASDFCATIEGLARSGDFLVLLLKDGTCVPVDPSDVGVFRQGAQVDIPVRLFPMHGDLAGPYALCNEGES